MKSRLLKELKKPLYKNVIFALAYCALCFSFPAQAQPLLPSCGNIKVLGDVLIDGRQISKGTYQLNTFGTSCEEVIGQEGVLGQVLSLGEGEKLPAPWTSLLDAVGAPKFSSGASVGFRLQRIDDLPLIIETQEQQLSETEITQNGRDSAIFKLRSSADFGITNSQKFLSSDIVTISAMIDPQDQDVGSPANIYVLARAINGGDSAFWSLGRLGNWEAWNGAIDGLLTAYTISSLEETLKLPIYSGNLPAGLNLEIYIAYSIISEEQTLLHYNSNSFVLTVD